MASILRSSKFVRYIAGFARNIVVNTPREFDGNFVNTTQCFCGAIPRSFATEASAQHDQNLERRLRTLDQDVRRSGRISRRDIEDVLEELRNTRSASSSQSLLVIRCCGNLVPEEMPETRTKLVQEIWNTLVRLDVPMDVSHYNALLRVYLENEHQFSPTDFLAEMESKGIEPNRVTYQRLIARYCQIGDIEGSTRILEFMKEKQLPVNENVFNALINGHSQAGDMDSAHGILGVMVQAGLEPSPDTYTTLLCGYAKIGDIQTITKTLEECEEKEIYLLDKDLLDIIFSLATNGHKEHVPEILTRVRKTFGYNQDAVNVIFRLINKGHEDAGFAVLKSMTRGVNEEGVALPSGPFFIKQLVRANRPVEKIIEYCNILKSEDMLDNGLLFATETSLQIANEKIAYKLLEELQENNIPIRQHFFWPLLKAKAVDPTGEGLIEVLVEMTKFGIQPNAETIREYILPHMQGRSSDIIAQLRRANISVGAAAANLVYSLLLKYDIEEAAIIASRVPAFYYPDLLRRPLTNAFYKTKNIKAYLTIVRMVHENLSRKDVIELEQALDSPEVVGRFLLDLTISKGQFSEMAEEILAACVEHGLSISTICAEKLEDKMGEKMTPEISVLLGKLSSGELTPTPIVRQQPAYTPATLMNIPQLERLIHNLDAKKQDTRGHKRQLYTLYYRAKDLDKMQDLIKNFESNRDFVQTSGLYAQLLDTQTFHEKLEDALETKKKIVELDSAFSLDETKIIRLAGLLIKNDRFQEACDLIRDTTKSKTAEERSYSYNALCWRVLNSLAEKGKDEELEDLFKILLEKDYIEVNNIILGPLVKVHLVKNDVEGALRKFEFCCNQFKTTPWKNELTCKLIQAEDAEKLQRITDLSTSVHGEINSLYDLVFAFVECGRTRQARKILETPGLQSRPQRLNAICQRYQMEGMVKPLEGLKDATKDLDHIDRSDIYYQLLLSYIKQEEPDKALGLWTQMQEENMAPSDEFLMKLGTFLKANNMDVPFAIPDKSNMKIASILKAPARNVGQQAPKKMVQPKPVKQEKSDVQTFRQCVKNNDLNAALEIKKASKENFNTSDLSVLVEKLVQSDRHQDAIKLVSQMLDVKAPPLTRVFRFLLNKLASVGDTESLELIEKKLTPDMKKLVSFDNRICHSNLVNGKAEEYLDKLGKDVEEATDEDLATVGEKFPRGGAVGILERYPELEEKFKDLASKYAKRGIIAPMNVLWNHYYITNKLTEAEQIWKEYLQGAPRIMFQRVVQHARDTKDEILTKKLIEHLKTSQVTEGAIGNAYSCLLDVLVSKEKHQEVYDTFEIAVKEVNPDTINRTAVLRVKDTYEKLGKPFNHKIPPKVNNKNTSTNMPSDDEQHMK